MSHEIGVGYFFKNSTAKNCLTKCKYGNIGESQCCRIFYRYWTNSTLKQFRLNAK